MSAPTRLPLREAGAVLLLVLLSLTLLPPPRVLRASAPAYLAESAHESIGGARADSSGSGPDAAGGAGSGGSEALVPLPEVEVPEEPREPSAPPPPAPHPAPAPAGQPGAPPKHDGGATPDPPPTPPGPQPKPLVPLEQLRPAHLERVSQERRQADPPASAEKELQPPGADLAQQGPAPSPEDETQGREEPEGVLEPGTEEPAPLKPPERLRPQPPAAPPQPPAVRQLPAVREPVALPRTGYDVWAVLVLGFGLLLSGIMGRRVWPARPSASRAP